MAVYEFYIRNYRDASGNVITNETLIQTIPLQNEPVLINPRVKTDLGKAGSFEFSMERNSPYYDTLLQMKTIMRVTFYGETIFRGRVLTIDRNMAGTRTIHCEGDLAFLLDSHQEGVKDDDRPYTGLLNYMTDVLQQHNNDVHDPQKVFAWGEVPLGYFSAEADQRLILPEEKLWQQFGSSSWDTTMDRLESLLGEFGGYFRTRYVPSTGVTYIDWYDNYFRGYTGQKIEVTKNLIDISGPTEVENLFTVVVPIGKKDRKKNSKTNKDDDDDDSLYITNYWSSVDENHDAVNYMTVEDIVGLYTDAELNTGYHRKSDYQNAISRFGYIWKVVDFENADTEEKLFNYCKDYIRQNFMPELTQWSVTALDMKFVGGGERAILTGDRVALTHPEVDHRFDSITVISAEYDCTNPERNKYTIGVPNQQINASYGVKKKSGGSSKKSSKAASAGITEEKTAADAKKEANSAAEDITRIRETLRNQYSMKTDWHQDISLDDPFAFLTYRDDGVTAIPLADSTREFSKVTRDLANTRKMAPLNAELVAEAKKRGVSINDPQLLIDFTESAAKAQNKFKADTTKNMLSYGLDPVMIDVLLNTSASTSTGASLVDDDGNWTQKALNQGAANWDPKVKQMAIQTRNILQGKTTDTTAFGGVVSWFKDTVWGAAGKLADSLNVGDSFSFTNDGKQLNVGDMITTGVDAAGKKVTELMGGVVKLTDTKVTETVNNVVTKITNGLGIKIGDPSASTGTINVDTTVTKTNPDTAEEVTKKDISFTIQNDKVNIDGENGTAGVGKKQNGSWQVFLNDTVTYKDKSNQNKTASGFVSAQDFKVGTSVNSLSTELLVVRDLIADKITANTVISTAAQIEDLVGQKASITDLESATGRITTLEGDVANIKKITAQSITADTYVSADIGKFNQLYVSNSGKDGQPVGISGDMIIDGNLTIKIDARDYVNLKNALSNISSGGFKDGKLTVKQQKMDGTFGTDLTFDVTQTDWYADVVLGAQNAGIASAKISKWNDLTKSIRYENGKLKLTHHVEAIRKDTVPNEDGGYDDVTIGTVSGISNPNDFALEVTDQRGSGLAFDAGETSGWNAALSKIDWQKTEKLTLSSTTVKLPQSTVLSTGQDTLTFNLKQDSGWTNNKKYIYIRNLTNAVDVARAEVDASDIVSDARKAGWSAAYGKVSLPSTQNNTGSMVVKTPAETEDATPNPVSTTYTLEQDDDWGSNNKKYVYIQNGTSEKNVARMRVDASTIVNTAATNATNAAKAAVTLTGSWSNGKYTVTNSANDKKASTKLENIALNGNLSSSNGKLYAPLKVNILDDNEDEVAVFTQNSLQLGSISWTNKNITNTSGSSSVEAEVSIGNVVLTHSYAGTYAAADSDNETVRADGWAAAFDKVSLPSTEPVSNWPSKVTIGTPKSTENATADTTDYSLTKGSWSNNKMYVYITNGTNHANVARTEVDASQLVSGVSLTELTIPATNLSYASSKLSITPKYKLSTMTAAANWSSAIEVPWYTKVGISGGTKTYTPTNQTAYYDTPLVVSAKAGTSSNPTDEADSATYALASTAVPVLNSSDARLYTKSRATIAGTEYSCRLWQIGSIEVSAKIVPKTGTTNTVTDSFSITAKAKDQATNPNTLAIASKTLSISGTDISMSTTTGTTTVQVKDGTTVLAEKTINATYTGSTGGGVSTVKYFANGNWHVVPQNSDDNNPTYLASDNPHLQVYSGSTLTHRFAINIGSPANVQSKNLGVLSAGQEYTVTPDSGYAFLTQVTFTTPSSGTPSTPTSHAPYATGFFNNGTNAPQGGAGIWQTVSPLGSLPRYFGFYVQCGSSKEGPYYIKVTTG